VEESTARAFLMYGDGFIGFVTGLCRIGVRFDGFHVRQHVVRLPPYFWLGEYARFRQRPQVAQRCPI